MSLISCSECGKEISDKATVCPDCGNPVQAYFDSAPYDILSNHEVKKCSGCGRDIPKKLGKCPYCGKTQNIIGGIIGIAVILFFIFKIVF